MKPKQIRISSLLACLAFAGAGSTFATTYTWDGGDTTNANWGQANNWNPDAVPTFDNTADVILHEAGTPNNRLTNAISGNRTIRSLTFNASATAAVSVRTRQAIGGGQVGRVLTFDADTGNATINVNASASANHVVNGGSVSTGGTGGSIDLVDSLDVVHNGTGTLTLGQNNNGSNVGSETIITGAGGINKSGTGLLALAGPNTFTGGVSIESGSLELVNNSAAGSNIITMSAPDTEGAFSELRFNNAANLTLSNALVISDAGQVKRLRKFGAGTAVYAGNITVNETTEGLFEIQVGTGNTLTVTGDISDTGTAGIEKINPGILILQGAKSYTGTTTVSGGTLTLDTAYLADASSVKIGTGAFLNLTHSSTDTVDKLFINGVQQQAGVYTAIGNAGVGENEIAGITGTGKLQVTSSPSVSGYASWLTGYTFAPGADTTRTGDPDGDGFTNLEEFLFGTNPTTGTEVLSSVEKSGTDIVIRWKERTTGCTYQIKQSATLANDWVNAVGGTIGNDGLAVGDYQPRIATIPVGSAKLFFRVEGIEN